MPTGARVGRRAPFTLQLRNASRGPVEAHFLGRTIVFDIVVARENGAIVWRRLEHGMGPSILQLRTLKPSESLQWHGTWLPKEPGHYQAQGILPSDAPEPLRTPWVAFSVSP
ncbi:MAG TPA: BsuPI-related putative proteinase inhibitor [Gemmatimonadales bacterium]|nr:BsuPI-related putative proteinase inhibitor [Gemmatimonadales bacterium]